MARNLKDIPKSNGKKMNAPLLEAGSYPARVVGVVYLGVQKQMAWKGETKAPKLEVQYFYELSHEFMQDDDGKDIEDKPRWFSESLPVHGPEADKAKITLRNKAIDPTDSADGDLSKLLSFPCSVLIIHKPGTGKNAGKTMERIGGVAPGAGKLKGYVQPDLVNDSFYLDPWDKEACSLETFRKLPEWLRTKIMGADDFKSSHLSTLIGEGKDDSVGESNDDASNGTTEPGSDDTGTENPW
jgi:hypothetical protein